MSHFWSREFCRALYRLPSWLLRYLVIQFCYEGLEGCDSAAALECFDRHVQHGQMIGHEEGIELAAFQGLDALDQVLQAEIRFRR